MFSICPAVRRRVIAVGLVGCAGVSRPESHLEAAAAALAQHGPVDRTVGVSAAMAARWAGVARSTIYRYWPTIEALNADIVDHADASTGWIEAVVGSDPSAPIAATLTRALATEGRGERTSLRAVASGWDPQHQVRRRVAERELERLDLLRGWLEAWAHGRRHRFADEAAFAAAFAITSVMEGHLVFKSARGPVAADDEPERTQLGADEPIIALLERILTLMTAPDPGAASADATVHPTPVPERRTDVGSVHPSQQRLIERVTREVLAEIASGGHELTSGRLVDVERLARRRGVSDRRLYHVWPDSSDLNRKLVRLVLDRFREAMATIADEAFAIGLAAPDGFDDVFVQAFEQVVRVGAVGWAGQPPVFWCARALLDPENRLDVMDVQDRWEDASKARMVAGQALAGRRPLEGLLAPELMARVASGVLGAIRLCALNGELLDRTATDGGRSVPLTGLPGILVSRAMSLPLRGAELEKESSSSIRRSSVAPFGTRLPPSEQRVRPLEPTKEEAFR